MKEKLQEYINRGNNTKYCIDQIHPDLVLKHYIEDKNKKLEDTISDLSISGATLKNIYKGESIGPKTLAILENALSNYIKSGHKTITKEDLLLEHDEFKKLFPESCFNSIKTRKQELNLKLFTNKLYRCYYKTPNSPDAAYMAYFKLFQNGSELQAYMLRGVYLPDYREQDFRYFENNIINAFSTTDGIKELYDFQDTNGNKKQQEAWHLYIAKHTDIDPTDKCIKIDFKSREPIPCRCTMIWNIVLATKFKLSTYTGGSALMIDTNDGKRNKSIAAFKLGMEDISEYSKVIDSRQPKLLMELSIPTRNDITILDEVSDDCWYSFIRDKGIRGKYEPDRNMENMIKSFECLLNEYKSEIHNLKLYINENNLEKK